MKKHPKKHTKQQNQNQPEKICFILKTHYSSEQKKVDKVFFDKKWANEKGGKARG